MNQLLRENNQAADKTWTWVYDNAGNILSRSEYVYTTASLEGITPVDTVTYTYGDSNWSDLLTAYDGNTITYDEIGNPLSDGTWSYTWENGRQLASMTDGETTWNFTYDANGMRTSRTDGTTTYNYVYNGSQLVQMSVGNDVLYFTSDTVTYNNTVYYYVTNLQGDIVAILNSGGTAVVQYTYDAWGNVLSASGTMADTLGQLNPLRYRGYVYDTESGFYYLQSRYYDPEIGRFLNADAFISTGQGILGNNMFAYCNNNPVNASDKNGNMSDTFAGWIGEEIGKLIYELITGEDHPSNQTENVEIYITQKQNSVIGNGVKAAWDLCMREIAREQEHTMFLAQSNLDMFDSPEDIERSIDVIESTMGFATASYELAQIIISPVPPSVKAVVLVIGGIIWGARELSRALQ